MTHPIPPDAQRLANRLRFLADEVESAARYGVPIPWLFTVPGHPLGSVSFSADEAEFTAWVKYTSAVPEHYVREGIEWSRVETDLNELPLSFAVSHGKVVSP